MPIFQVLVYAKFLAISPPRGGGGLLAVILGGDVLPKPSTPDPF